MSVTNPAAGTPDARTSDAGAAPAVSVIVPVHRAVATIGETLESLAAQTLPGLVIVLTGVGFSLIGDGIADRLGRDFSLTVGE